MDLGRLENEPAKRVQLEQVPFPGQSRYAQAMRLPSVFLLTGLLALTGTLRAQQAAHSLTQTAKGFVFHSRDGTPLPLSRVREVRFAASSRMLLTREPLRTFGFPGGDSLTAELIRWDPRIVRIRVREKTVDVDRASVTEIGTLTGQRLLLQETFPEGGTTQLLELAPDAPREWQLPESLADGLIQIWTQGTAAAHLELLSPGGHLRLQVPLPDSASDQWVCLRIWLQPGATRVTHDIQLVSEAGSPGEIGRLRLARDPGPGTRLVDDLLVQNLNTDDVRPRSLRLSSQDIVQLFTGDEVLGRLQNLTGTEAELKTPFGPHRLRWTEIRRVLHTASSRPGRTVSGLICRIDLNTVLGSVGTGPEGTGSDRLTGAITALTDDEVQFEHEWLGPLSIPKSEIGRIVPQFVGRVWPLDLAPHHLGDEVRTDFESPRAEGSTFSMTWTPPEGLLDDPRISLRAADLEPCGPATPAGSLYLNELQAGGLVTELRVNGQRVATLNRLINTKSLPDAPALLRVPVPRRMLKAGVNTIQFLQRPLRTEPTVLDDVQISHVRIELPSK